MIPPGRREITNQVVTSAEHPCLPNFAAIVLVLVLLLLDPGSPLLPTLGLVVLAVVFVVVPLFLRRRNKPAFHAAYPRTRYVAIVSAGNPTNKCPFTSTEGMATRRRSDRP